jgi:hypothetical protein
MTPQKVDGSITCDTGEPVCHLIEIFDLFLALEGFDEGFLRQVLGVIDVSHYPIDL